MNNNVVELYKNEVAVVCGGGCSCCGCTIANKLSSVVKKIAWGSIFLEAAVISFSCIVYSIYGLRTMTGKYIEYVDYLFDKNSTSRMDYNKKAMGEL